MIIHAMVEQGREKLELPREYVAMLEVRIKEKFGTKERAAERAGVSPSAWTRLRKGEGSWDTLLKFAAALDVDTPVLVSPGSVAARLAALEATQPKLVKKVLELVEEMEPGPSAKPERTAGTQAAIAEALGRGPREAVLPPRPIHETTVSTAKPGRVSAKRERKRPA